MVLPDQQLSSENNSMHIFNIQDADRPMYVIAKNWNEALEKWKLHIATENDMAIDEVEEPCGIIRIADSNDLIL